MCGKPCRSLLSFTLSAGFEGLEGVNVPLDVDVDTVININEKVGLGNVTEINGCFYFIYRDCRRHFN